MSPDLIEDAFSACVKAMAEAAPDDYPALQPPTIDGQTVPINYYTTGEKGTFKYPAISFEMLETNQLHANTEVSQGVLQIWIETQADDEAESVHVARVAAIEKILKNRPVIKTAINATGKVKLFGYSLATGTRELKDRHWTSGITCQVGYGPAPAPP